MCPTGSKTAGSAAKAELQTNRWLVRQGQHETAEAENDESGGREGRTRELPPEMTATNILNRASMVFNLTVALQLLDCYMKVVWLLHHSCLAVILLHFCWAVILQLLGSALRYSTADRCTLPLTWQLLGIYTTFTKSPYSYSKCCGGPSMRNTDVTFEWKQGAWGKQNHDLVQLLESCTACT